MLKLTIIYIVFNILLLHVYSKEIKFDMKQVNLKSFLATCLKQVQNNNVHDIKPNELNFRFLDDSKGKDFYINFTLSSNKTDYHPNRHLVSSNVYVLLLIISRYI